MIGQATVAYASEDANALARNREEEREGRGGQCGCVSFGGVYPLVQTPNIIVESRARPSFRVAVWVLPIMCSCLSSSICVRAALYVRLGGASAELLCVACGIYWHL